MFWSSTIASLIPHMMSSPHLGRMEASLSLGLCTFPQFCRITATVDKLPQTALLKLLLDPLNRENRLPVDTSLCVQFVPKLLSLSVVYLECLNHHCAFLCVSRTLNNLTSPLQGSFCLSFVYFLLPVFFIFFRTDGSVTFLLLC